MSGAELNKPRLEKLATVHVWSISYNITCLAKLSSDPVWCSAQQSKVAPQRSSSTTIFSIHIRTLLILFLGLQLKGQTRTTANALLHGEQAQRQAERCGGSDYIDKNSAVSYVRG